MLCNFVESITRDLNSDCQPRIFQLLQQSCGMCKGRMSILIFKFKIIPFKAKWNFILYDVKQLNEIFKNFSSETL